MSTQSDPLKVTTQELHRFWFAIATTDQWYAIMRECRTWFGPNWRSMSKVKRKLSQSKYHPNKAVTVPVWFEVPDPRFATWVSVKMSIQVQGDSKYQAAKY